MLNLKMTKVKDKILTKKTVQNAENKAQNRDDSRYDAVIQRNLFTY